MGCNMFCCTTAEDPSQNKKPVIEITCCATAESYKYIEPDGTGTDGNPQAELQLRGGASPPRRSFNSRILVFRGGASTPATDFIAQVDMPPNTMVGLEMDFLDNKHAYISMIREGAVKMYNMQA